MMYGTRGCGKTSLARLLAKEILCESPVDGHSCGQCEICQSIDEYITSSDADAVCEGIYEINAASATGKEDVENIMAIALEPPMYPLRRKVLILDECHKLSKAAQNSLLKVIEEPPPHLIIMLCTTDPDDVIATIHSRMQVKVEVKKKTVEELVDFLLKICEQEGIKTSREALARIVRSQDRIPRDSINKLESIAKNNGNVVLLDNVNAELGDISNSVFIDYFKAAQTGLEDILNFLSNIKAKGLEAKAFMSSLARFLIDALNIKHGISLDDYPTDYIKDIKSLFEIYSSNDFDTLLQIIEYANNNISTDDNRNDMLLITTALRIGKVKLMALGLSKEQAMADSENRKSLNAYREKINSSANQSKQLQEEDISRQKLASVFKNLKTVDVDMGAIEFEDDSDKHLNHGEEAHIIANQTLCEPAIGNSSEPISQSTPDNDTDDQDEFMDLEELSAQIL